MCEARPWLTFQKRAPAIHAVPLHAKASSAIAFTRGLQQPIAVDRRDVKREPFHSC